jgi:3-dehydrosphinganine reductase
MQYRGVHAMVTGGSSGIGRALVSRLVDLGSNVSVLALDDDDLESVAAEYAESAATVTTHAVDVRDEAQTRSVIADASALHGPCDLLVTSAGIARPGRFLELPNGEFEREMQVNFFGTLYAIRAVTPSMIERRRGRIVAISSAAGLLGVFGYSAYGSTKYAVRGLCDVLRTELKPHGVYVGCVFPTDVDTPQFAGEQEFLPDETKAIAGSVTPIAAEKVAAAILRGVDRRRANIFTDPTTMVLDRLVRMAPGLTQRWLDGKVAGVASGR